MYAISTLNESVCLFIIMKDWLLWQNQQQCIQKEKF